MRNIVLQLPAEAEKLTIQRQEVNEKTGRAVWRNYQVIDKPKERQGLLLESGVYRWSVAPKEYNELRV